MLTAPRAAGRRALVVDLSARFGGASARALGLVGAMPVGTCAIACLAGSDLARRGRAAGLEVHELARSKFDPRIARRLRRLVRAGGFDLVDTQNPQSRAWAGLALAGSGTAVVSTLNSWYRSEHDGRPKGRFYQALESALRRDVDLYVAVAPEIVENLRAGGVPADAIALIPNAVAIPDEAGPADPAALRARHGLPSDAAVVAAVGRLVEAKGYDRLIEAIAALVAEGRPVAALIVGEGHLRPALAEMVATLGQADRVRLVGFLEGPARDDLVRGADVFAMPSRTEGTPLALLEAAALGRPIVASRVGGIPTILADRTEALLVPPDDPGALARAIGELLDDPGLAGRLGAAARRRVVADFGLEAQATATRAGHDRARARRARR